LLVILGLSACSNQSNDSESSKGSTEDTILIRLNSAIKANPSSGDGYLERARYFSRTGNIDAALSDLERAIRADSTRGEYYAARGEIAFTKNDIKPAYQDYISCLRHDPDNTDCLLKAAEIELLLRNYKESLDHINSALRINQYTSHAYFMKGLIYAETGDTALAVSSYQTATEVDPSYYEAYIALGHLYSLVDNDLAIEYYNTAIDLKPASVEALYNKAIYMQESGYRDYNRYTEALELYDRIIAINPSIATPYYNKGYVYLEYLSSSDEGAYTEGEKWFTMALERRGDDYKTFYNRGLCRESAGNIKGAEEDYRMSLKYDPQFESAAKALQRVLERPEKSKR
jgi:tetratricopeptide (TPR) repeat protein